MGVQPSAYLSSNSVQAGVIPAILEQGFGITCSGVHVIPLNHLPLNLFTYKVDVRLLTVKFDLLRHKYTLSMIPLNLVMMTQCT